jgi:hypothetical protein
MNKDCVDKVGCIKGAMVSTYSLFFIHLFYPPHTPANFCFSCSSMYGIGVEKG